jgi:putative Ca2+/H+ antiporter (TMEM165/GDT1 family)
MVPIGNQLVIAPADMQAFLISTAGVALAELGDKTQLLALVLAAKFRRPWPIAFGILLATLANHTLAGAFGALVAAWFTPQVLRWLVAASFIAVAAWTLIPDRIDESEPTPLSGHGVLLATFVAFFLAEIGDKTQIATAVLGAQYHPLWQVVAGTTCGMLIADVPAIWLGARFAHTLPLRATRLVAAALFAALGLWILLG